MRQPVQLTKYSPRNLVQARRRNAFHEYRLASPRSNREISKGMRISGAIVILSILFIGNAEAGDRENTVCGAIQERFLFWLWSSATPEPDKDRALISPLIEPTKFTTSDDKVLRGYKYSSHNTDKQKTPPKGYVLMALGNAMIADQIITSMRYMSARGLDVYIFDYRGYGNSDGKRRINAIIADYKEIITFLNSKYDKHFIYGISLGGAIILNAIGSGVNYDLAVIDSSPSKFSDYGCPESIDPINNLPDDASRIFVITGKKDQVLKPEMTSSLRVEAEKRGANTAVRLSLYEYHLFLMG